MSVTVHPNGICESPNVGDGTRVWAFAHVLAGASIGRDCNICDHVFIENDVVIGDRVTIKCGVQLWDGVRIEDDAFIGPNATFTNDHFPRSKQYKKPLETRICKGASISANCTILPGLTIGRDAMVGAGAVVTHNVPPRTIVMGSPARIVGYVDAVKLAAPAAGVEASSQPLIGGASVHQLTEHADLRGSLTAASFTEQMPFAPRRFFVVFGVPGKEVRGEHAHRNCHQFLICVSGSVAVLVDDGREREEIPLDHPSRGLYVPPMVWSVQYRYSEGAVLLVFASDEYDPADYVRDYDEFLRLRGAGV